MCFVLRQLLITVELFASLSAQSALFEERFDRGIPSTWTHELLGVGADVWRAGTSPSTNSGDAYHEYFCTNGTLLRDNRLVTPAVDLRGLDDAQLQWNDEQVLPTWRLLNAVEASVGGGAFTTIYTVTRTTPGRVAVTVDLGAFVGRADVRFGFRYRGDIANEWRIDDVRVTTSQPVHAVRNLVAGASADFVVAGAVAGSAVAIGMSLQGPGPVPTAFGAIHLTPPIVLFPTLTVGVSGTVALPVPIPTGVVGLAVWTHAIELQPPSTVRLTNAVTSSVR